MGMVKKTDVAIIGAGPAGWTAATYVARSGFKPTVFCGIQPGGQLTTTTDVENFPGFPEGILGPKLMLDMQAQAERFGTETILETIETVDFSSWPFKLEYGETTCLAGSVIIATGATAKTLGLAGEAELMGRGLSTCATCDGFFYRGKIVAIAGGGDSAMEEASYLAKLCKKVYLIHRRDVFKASQIMLDRAKGIENIEFLVPYQVESMSSDKSGLTGLNLVHSETHEKKELDVDGFFMAIGHKPNSDIFTKYVDVDEHGYIDTETFTETKTKGVFAAGDIADTVFKQAITAAGMGCQAAMQSTKYLEQRGYHGTESLS